jgi:hypothetical protein
MKQVILIIAALLMQLPLVSQEVSIKTSNIPVDEETGLIVYQEVVQQEGTKAELFNRAGEWLHQFYANPVHVTKVRDAASGLIKGKHSYNLIQLDKDGNKLDAGTVLYSFKIECKDDRYRWTVDELFLKRSSRFPLERWLDTSDPSYNPAWADYLQQFDTFVWEEFAASLKEAMLPKVEKVEEEW